MIKLKIDTEQLVKELDNKLAGIQEMVSPSVLQEVAKAVFTITGERFMTAVDSYARRNPKKMHHIYEWGQIGNPSKRLFVLERTSILNGNLLVTTKFLQSRTPVPINQELLMPGRTGKAVSRRNLFRDKASVMESGRPVSFTARRVLAFMGSNGTTFIAPGTKVNILHPGGRETTDALGKYMLDWYTRVGNQVMESSGFYEKLSNSVADILEDNGAGVVKVRQEVARIASTISNEKKVIK